jgi:DNA-binding NarL/FixJ family response regulator
MTPEVGVGRKAASVLIVDDSGYARQRLRKLLVERGFSNVVEAEDGDEALLKLAKHRPALVLMDQVMRRREGLETARLMLEQDADLCVVMLTVVSDRAFHQRALATGIHRVLLKGDLESLGALLDELGHE